jgi:hypothetical protein
LAVDQHILGQNDIHPLEIAGIFGNADPGPAVIFLGLGCGNGAGPGIDDFRRQGRAYAGHQSNSIIWVDPDAGRIRTVPSVPSNVTTVPERLAVNEAESALIRIS